MENYEENEKIASDITPEPASSNLLNEQKTTTEQEEYPSSTNNTQKTNSWAYYFLWAFGFFFLLFSFFFGVYFQPIAVIGTSMQPTINSNVISETDSQNNDTVLYRKASSYNIGDIVIVSNEQNQYIPQTPTQDVDFFIKRVIARPGDTITFHYSSNDKSKYFYYISVKDSNGNSIKLNDEEYTLEPMYFIKYSKYDTYFDVIAPNLINENLNIEDRKTSITVSAGHYFVMGDNRNNSGDSRQFGAVAYEDICGNVRLLIKNNESVWTAIFRQIKESFVSQYNLRLKEYL